MNLFTYVDRHDQLSIQEREEIYKVLHDSMQIMSETARSFERKVKEHNKVGFNWSEHDWLGK